MAGVVGIALYSTCSSQADGVAAAADRRASDDAPQAAKSVDLRPAFQHWGLDVRLQGKRNTCSVFVMTQAIEFAIASRRQPEQMPRLSVEFLNWADNQENHETEDGGCFSQLWDGFVAHGVCPEAEMPYQRQYDKYLKPSEKAITDAKKLQSVGLRLHWIKEWDSSKGVSDGQLSEIKQTLARRWPVCGGFLWPKKKVIQWKDGVLQMCPRADVMDGHSVLLVGYRDDESQPGGGVFLIRNSADPSLDGMISYAYAKAYLNDASWVDYGGAAMGGPLGTHRLGMAEDGGPAATARVAFPRSAGGVDGTAGGPQSASVEQPTAQVARRQSGYDVAPAGRIDRDAAFGRAGRDYAYVVHESLGLGE